MTISDDPRNVAAAPEIAPAGNSSTSGLPNNASNGLADNVVNKAITYVVVDFEELVRKLKEEDLVTIKELLKESDSKELEAVKKYAKVAKQLMLRKKKIALKKGRWWRPAGGTAGRIQEKLKAAEKDIDEELGVAVLPQCYEEIKRLLYIEKNPIFAKALEEWSQKVNLFTNRVERKKSKAADLKNEIYQLLGFFSVFQGVLLTAVSQSNLLHCNNWWSPIGLSLVASGVTIFGVVQKLIQIDAFQKTIHSEEQSLKEVAARISSLRIKGKDEFEFAQFSKRENKAQSQRRFLSYLSLIIGGLVLFTVGFPISHWRILCYPGANPYAATVTPTQ